ncbi:MAG: hypothetical protein Q4G03_06565 [Planctomycetia bacterium]|nr:hypothetical protein [Planctomycetia bacterium]
MKESLSARRLILTCFFVSALAFMALCHTTGHLALTWDEGDAFYRAARISAWTRAVTLGPERAARAELSAIHESNTTLFSTTPSAVDDSFSQALRLYFAQYPTRRELFTVAALETGWQHVIYREGHPSGYSLTIACGRALATSLFPDINEKLALRIGVIFWFSLALGAVLWRVSSDRGFLAGALSVFFIVTSPHVFAHAQIAGGDSILISSWLLVWSFYDAARRRLFVACIWGLALGASFCAKFSGLLVLAPILVVSFADLLRYPRSRQTYKSLTRLALGICVACLVFYITNPPLWRAPWQGLLTYWTLNVNRPQFDIPIYFFGQFYSPSHPTPWWDGFFWLVATTPALTLCFAFVTIILLARRLFWRREEQTAFYLGNGGMPALAILYALTLPLARMQPGVPVHDGVRLLIASQPFLGILAGYGLTAVFQALWRNRTRCCDQRLGSSSNNVFSRVSATCILACCLTFNSVDLIGASPVYLSFYNEFIGGVVGAQRLGLETVYYWDAFDCDVVRTLETLRTRNKLTQKRDAVLFSSFSTQTLDYYRRWHVLDDAYLATISDQQSLKDLDRYGYYVLQRRASGLSSLDLALIDEVKPLFRLTLRNPWTEVYCRLCSSGSYVDVSVLEVYDFKDVRHVLERFRQENGAKDTDE